MTITKLLMPLTTLCIGVICAVAFKPVAHLDKHENRATFFWYQLKPGGNKNVATDYDKVASEPSCPNGSNVCAVHAQDDGTNHPLGIPSSGNVTTNQFIDQVDHRN